MVQPVLFQPKAEPPHNVEAEQQLLAALLLDSTLLSACHARGGRDLFYDPVHGDIFDVISGMEERGEGASVPRVQHELAGHAGMQELGKGQRGGYIAKLVGLSIGPPHLATDYVSILADLQAKRRLIALFGEARDALERGTSPTDEVASRVEMGLAALEGAREIARPVTMGEASFEALEEFARVRSGSSHVIRSGLQELDSIIGGFFPGQMTLFGGRPSMGKTALALVFALNAARAGHGVVFVSLEMRPEDIAYRAISEMSAATDGGAIHYDKMMRADVPNSLIPRMKQLQVMAAQLPIVFLPTTFAALPRLAAGLRAARKKLPEPDAAPLVIVDYAQLIEASGENRNQEISRISRAMKQICVRYSLPMVLLSQLSRGVEQRDNKRPQLSDLRDSGSLEQDADRVLFAYRDEYYEQRNEPPQDDLEKHAAWLKRMEKARNKVEVIVGKNRNGRLGTATCRMLLETNYVMQGSD